VKASVSAVIPVYNGAAFVREALDSVLGQVMPPAEVIVVDDGSTDDTHEVLLSFGPAIRVVRQPNQGLAAARNAGVARATQPLFAFCDADDCWTTGKLQRQVAVMEADPTIEAMFGHVREFVDVRLSSFPGVELRNPVDYVPARMAPAMLIRRLAFDRVGPFDPTLRAGHFMEWLVRAELAGLVSTMLPDVVLLRRLHGGNRTLDPDWRRELARTLHTSIQQRRRTSGQDA
jgi:glycosyltransferase involved in cell wall biosynthesis